MRQYFIVFLIAVFVSNVTLSVAFAAPCLKNSEHQMKTMQQDAEPCRDMMSMEGDPQPANDMDKTHCDGLCLCLHMTHAPALYLDNAKSTSFSDLRMSQIEPQAQNFVLSLNPTPPKQPPKA